MFADGTNGANGQNSEASKGRFTVVATGGTGHVNGDSTPSPAGSNYTTASESGSVIPVSTAPVVSNTDAVLPPETSQPNNDLKGQQQSNLQMSLGVTEVIQHPQSASPQPLVKTQPQESQSSQPRTSQQQFPATSQISGTMGQQSITSQQEQQPFPVSDFFSLGVFT